MSVDKKRRLDLFQNPIKNLPDLIKIVKEEKERKPKLNSNGNKKVKYLMKDKSGSYIL
jgi:hypothetical protein